MDDVSTKPDTGYLFLIGLLFMLLSSVAIGVFHIGVLFLFGIPVIFLILGYLLIWVSSTRTAYKSISSLSSIPLF